LSTSSSDLFAFGRKALAALPGTKAVGIADLVDAAVELNGPAIVGKALVASIDDLSRIGEYVVLTSIEKPLHSDAYSAQFAALRIKNGATLFLVAQKSFRQLQQVEDFRFFANEKKFSLTSPVACTDSVILALNSTRTVVASGEKLAISDQTHSAKFFGEVLKIAVSVGSSDIHIEARKPGKVLTHPTRVRLRVDGELIDADAFPVTYDLANDVIADVYTHRSTGKSATTFSAKATLSATFEERLVLTHEVDALSNPISRPVSGRVQTTATDNSGMDFVMRILYGDNDYIPTPSELGYLPTQVKQIDTYIGSHKRLCCLSGRVGSGKSTTQRSVFSRYPKTAKKYSVEDPVEYFHPNCSPIVIQRDANDPKAAELRYKEVLGALKRMDMDAVLLGEIRDLLTTGFVRDVCYSGHAVLSTVHSGSAIGQLSRFATPEMGLTYADLSNPDFIGLLIYQTLVPKVCQHCVLRGAQALNELGTDLLTTIESKFKVDIQSFVARNPKGCSKCHVPNFEPRNGYKGRLVVAETYAPSFADLEIIGTGNILEIQRSWADQRSSKGFADIDANGKTVQEVGLYHALQGTVDPRSVSDKCEQWDAYRMLKAA
jgi:general secretion pathway protein E